jgi:hypothetical protein
LEKQLHRIGKPELTSAGVQRCAEFRVQQKEQKEGEEYDL